jgi:SAM-dependent methyltransferase
MQDEVYQTMFDIEDRHWWYVAKQEIVLDLLRRYLPPQNGHKPRIADLGCGCGAMLNRMNATYEAVGVDGSPHAIEFCNKRGVHAQLSQLGAELSLPKGEFDAVLLLDVLEHIDDDVNTVAHAASLLRTGGIMICTVPAYKWLWSHWDTIHHHYRRYCRGQFRKLFERPELKIELLSYANTILFPIAATVRTIQRITGSTDESGMRIPAKPLNWAFRTVYSNERHLLGRLPLPFGLSVVAVSRKL